MVIIKVDLVSEKEEIHNEMPLLLEWVLPYSKVLIDNLEFHTKSRSHVGLLSSAYLIAQRFFLLDLQVNYLSCPYDIQEKLSSYVQENGLMSYMRPVLTIIIIIAMIFGSLRVQQSTFSIGLELVVLASKPIQSLQVILSLKSGNMDW